MTRNRKGIADFNYVLDTLISVYINQNIPAVYLLKKSKITRHYVTFKHTAIPDTATIYSAPLRHEECWTWILRCFARGDLPRARYSDTRQFRKRKGAGAPAEGGSGGGGGPGIKPRLSARRKYLEKVVH